MAVCTYSDVFQFVGAPSDVQTTQQAAITTLILNVVSQVEQLISRKIESYAVTDIRIINGSNCEVYGQNLYLKNELTDLYAISSLTLNNEALTQVSNNNETGDYFFHQKSGNIIRNLQPWENFGLGLKVSGNVGLNSGTVPLGLKQAIIEMVAAKSGLWKQHIMTEGGRMETIRTTVSKDTMDFIAKYKLRSM